MLIQFFLKWLESLQGCQHAEIGSINDKTIILQKVVLTRHSKQLFTPFILNWKAKLGGAATKSLQSWIIVGSSYRYHQLSSIYQNLKIPNLTYIR